MGAGTEEPGEGSQPESPYKPVLSQPAFTLTRESDLGLLLTSA